MAMLSIYLSIYLSVYKIYNTLITLWDDTPVANAFAILGIVMAIFAVLARDLYAARDPYNFGSFSRAYFTMFQVSENSPSNIQNRNITLPLPMSHST
jgi:hypothetical protein